MGTLEIKLFGTLSLTYDGHPLERLPSKRVKDLLSYLLLNREVPHAREKLAALFWGELEDRKARHCLNTALWRLNRVLAQPDENAHPYLRVDAELIGFNTASDFRLDVAEFEASCQLARSMGDRSKDQQAALYRQAVAVYQSDLLTDCYEEWCVVERERLIRLHFGALGQLLNYHSQTGAHDTAIECGLRILACDPLREEVHRDVIRLYLAVDRPSAALRQYRTCADVLRRELGIDPMPETQCLLSEIAASSESTTFQESVGPGGRVGSGEPTASQNLGAALSRLYEAAATFEAAYAQLVSATERVKEIADRMGSDTVSRPRNAEPGAPHFRQAQQLISEAVRNLEDIAS